MINLEHTKVNRNHLKLFVTRDYKVHSKHKHQMTVVSCLCFYWGMEFLLHEACTLTTEDTDPRDGNRLKKVSAYSSIDST